MPANRFYLDANLSQGSTVFLEGTEYHHLIHVMRHEIGGLVELVDGKGTLAQAKIQTTEKKKGSLSILSSTHAPRPTACFSLGIPLMRASKLEWIIEKGTELGAHAFLFYPAERSEKEALSASQLERLYTIAISSLKQSGRLYLPALEILSDLSSLFLKETRVCFGDPERESKNSLSELRSFPMIFVTGPEAGFSKDELDLLRNQAIAIRLNPFILRAETAPIAAASLLGFFCCY